MISCSLPHSSHGAPSLSAHSLLFTHGSPVSARPSPFAISPRVSFRSVPLPFCVPPAKLCGFSLSRVVNRNYINGVTPIRSYPSPFLSNGRRIIVRPVSPSVETVCRFIVKPQHQPPKQRLFGCFSPIRGAVAVKRSNPSAFVRCCRVRGCFTTHLWA